MPSTLIGTVHIPMRFPSAIHILLVYQTETMPTKSENFAASQKHRWRLQQCLDRQHSARSVGTKTFSGQTVPLPTEIISCKFRQCLVCGHREQR